MHDFGHIHQSEYGKIAFGILFLIHVQAFSYVIPKVSLLYIVPFLKKIVFC